MQRRSKKGSDIDALIGKKKKAEPVKGGNVFRSSGELPAGMLEAPRMPWPASALTPPLADQDKLRPKSETSVYKIHFAFANDVEQYPIANNKVAAMIPNGSINSKFCAALIFIRSKFDGTNHIVTSTLMTMSNLIVAGIKKDMDVLDTLFQLIIELDAARLPIPRFVDFEVIAITVCNKFPSTVLIHKTPNFATPGFKSCFMWDFKLFPAQDIRIRLYPNSELQLERRFPKSVVTENWNADISIKLSAFNSNSCGGKDKDIIQYVHASNYNYIANPDNHCIVPNIILDKHLLAAEREANREKREKLESERRARERDDRNRTFKLMLEVDVRFVRHLERTNQLHSRKFTLE